MFGIEQDNVDPFFKAVKQLTRHFPITHVCAHQQPAIVHLAEILFPFEIEGEFLLKSCEHHNFIKQNLSKLIIVAVYTEECFNTAILHYLVIKIKNGSKGFTRCGNEIDYDEI